MTVAFPDAAGPFPMSVRGEPRGRKSRRSGPKSGTAMMRRTCRRLVRARDVDMTMGRGHPEYIMLKIVPAQIGRLRLDRVDVTYRSGLQRGTQGIDFHLTVIARPTS